MASDPSVISLSRGRKIALLGALYLAQGLPFGFFTLALRVVLRQAGYSLTAISALSLLFLPWALKFLWAPAVDRLGRRRTWLLGLQAASVVAALLLSQIDLEDNLAIILAGAFLFNLIAASQDIVTDGLAVRILDARERGLANGIQVGAYRIGMILGGGFLLWVFARSNWSVMFLCMAGLLALTTIPVWSLEERGEIVPSERPATGYLLAGWLNRLLTPSVLGMGLLIFFYRFGDQMAASLFGPFLTDFGLSTEMIALMKGTIGSLTSVIGAAIGGWFAYSVGRRYALLVSGIGQAGCYVLYVLAAAKIGGVAILWWATILEGVIGTMATVALFTLMMDASDPEHAGTDYTLLASVVVLVGSLGDVSGALIADRFGYATAFATGMSLALLGCLALVWTLDRHPISERVAAVWASRGR